MVRDRKVALGDHVHADEDRGRQAESLFVPLRRADGLRRPRARRGMPQVRHRIRPRRPDTSAARAVKINEKKLLTINRKGINRDQMNATCFENHIRVALQLNMNALTQLYL